VAYDVDRSPGEWVTREAKRRERFVNAMLAFGFCCWLAAVAAWFSGQHVVAILVLGASLLFFFAARESIDGAINWLKGSNAEIAVGEELNELRHRDYRVLHDVMFGHEGNLDHLAAGPNGAFLIETKFSRYELAQLTKVKRQAARVHDEIGCFVIPIMCAGKRRRPYKHRGVWIAGRGQLVDLITSLAGDPVDPERLARFADRIN
jgi:Nuclease-related domain